MKALRYLVFLIISISLMPLCYGQCNVGIEFSQKKKSEANFSIYLKPEKGLRNVQVQLVDLYEGKVIKDKGMDFLSERLTVEIFKDVKPSLYYIYIKFEGCDKKGLGGVSGFKVGDE